MRVVFLFLMLCGPLLIEAQKDTTNVEIIQRMSRIEAQHMTIEANQKVALDEMEQLLKMQGQVITNTADIANLRSELKAHEDLQLSDPQDIAVLKDQMSNVAKLIETTLAILASAITGIVLWAFRQMKRSSALTKALEAQKKALDEQNKAAAGIAAALDLRASLDAERHRQIVRDIATAVEHSDAAQTEANNANKKIAQLDQNIEMAIKSGNK